MLNVTGIMRSTAVCLLADISRAVNAVWELPVTKENLAASHVQLLKYREIKTLTSSWRREL